MWPSAYIPVAEDDTSLNSEKHLNDDRPSSLASYFERNSTPLILILSIFTFLFASISITLAVKLFLLSEAAAICEIGYDTEIGWSNYFSDRNNGPKFSLTFGLKRPQPKLLY